jgi:hypothetical protein
MTQVKELKKAIKAKLGPIFATIEPEVERLCELADKPIPEPFDGNEFAEQMRELLFTLPGVKRPRGPRPAELRAQGKLPAATDDKKAAKQRQEAGIGVEAQTQDQVNQAVMSGPGFRAQEVAPAPADTKSEKASKAQTGGTRGKTGLEFTPEIADALAKKTTAGAGKGGRK